VGLAHQVGAAAILTLTETGSTSRSISKYRPRCPILAVTPSPRVVRRLALNWGVTPLAWEGPVASGDADEERVAFGLRSGAALGCLRPGDRVVVTAGISRAVGSTNRIRVVAA
jgi:pyruvate kinase